MTERTIKETIVSYYGISAVNLFNKRLSRYPYEEARDSYIYLVREYKVSTFVEIAKLFNCTVRAVHYRLNQFKQRKEETAIVARDIEMIQSKLNAKEN